MATPDTASPDTISAMDTGLFFDYLGVKLNDEKAADATLTMNFIFPDINEKFVVELSHGALHHIKGYQADDADAAITLDRATLNNLILKNTTLSDALENKKSRLMEIKTACNNC